MPIRWIMKRISIFETKNISLMKEESRRKIARLFLEKKFGKYGWTKLTDINNRKVIVQVPFELWRSWDSMIPKTFEARAFEVVHAPYVSGAVNKRIIAVSDSAEELNEIVEKCFDQERIKAGYVEYDNYKQYKIAYD